MRTADISPEAASIELYRRLDQCAMCSGGDFRVVHRERATFQTDDPYFLPYRNTEMNLEECQCCGFAFTGKLPAATDFFDRLYSRIQPDWDLEYSHHGKQRINAAIKKQLLVHANAGGRLLDIGSWAGSFVALMSDSFQSQGIEIHAGGARCAVERGHDVECGSFLNIPLRDESFDVVTLIDVLEHLVDPGKILEKARRILTSSGLLYIKVPNYRAQKAKQGVLQKMRLTEEGIMDDFVHINHFAPKTLPRHLTRIGFDVLRVQFTAAESWDLGIPGVSLQTRSRRILRNLVVDSATQLLNLMSSTNGIALGPNFSVLARKRAN